MSRIKQFSFTGFEGQAHTGVVAKIDGFRIVLSDYEGLINQIPFAASQAAYQSLGLPFKPQVYHLDFENSIDSCDSNREYRLYLISFTNTGPDWHSISKPDASVRTAVSTLASSGLV
jgi:hypothetical protein